MREREKHESERGVGGYERTTERSLGHIQQKWYISVTRDRFYQPESRRWDVTSFLFFNFPENWEVVSLWKTFKLYGEVSDIYMAGKRMRNGKKFGFVRFKNVDDIRKMEQRLGGIWIGSYKLRVFIAGEDHRRAKQGGATGNKDVVKQPQFQKKTYCEAAKEGNKQEEKMGERNYQIPESIGEWNTDEMQKNKLRRCLIGNLKCLDHLEVIQTLCKAGNIVNCKMKYLGGRNVLLQFEGEESMLKVLENKTHGLHLWIKDLRR